VISSFYLLSTKLLVPKRLKLSPMIVMWSCVLFCSWFWAGGSKVGRTWKKDFWGCRKDSQGFILMFSFFYHVLLQITCKKNKPSSILFWSFAHLSKYDYEIISLCSSLETVKVGQYEIVCQTKKPSSALL
jgi:hypothetical protein